MLDQGVDQRIDQAPATPGEQRVAKHWGTTLPGVRRIWRHRWPVLFISPFYVLFAVFMVYPVGFSVWLSLHQWRGVGEMQWIGLDNYRTLRHDRLFWETMRNAVILFLVYVPLMTFAAVVVASILNTGFLRLQGLWRALIFLPHITSMVAAGYTFRLMLDTHSGAANAVMGWLGLGPVPWLDDRWWARVSLGLLMVWSWLGYNTVIMLAGLQTIPPELAEAARVDGAGRVQVFRHITVPLLRPVIAFALTLSVIGTFQMYTEPLILTQGGPFRSTRTPVMEIFATTFENVKFGYAAAMSYVYFAVIVVVTLVQFRFVGRESAA